MAGKPTFGKCSSAFFRYFLQMLKTTQNLYSLEQTGSIMGDIAIRFCNDVLPYSDLTIYEFQDFIKNLPYRDDPVGEEFVSRPMYPLNDLSIPFDCDDRCVCIGAYCTLKGIPFRFVAVCEKPEKDFHHVYTEICVDNKWIECDATYPEHLIGQPKKDVSKRKVIFDVTDIPTLKGIFL